MRQVCQVGLLIAVLLMGCSSSKEREKKTPPPEDSGKAKVGKVDDGGKTIDRKAKQREEDYQLAMSAARDAVKKKNYKGAVHAFKEALRLKPADKNATAGLDSAEALVKAEETKKPDPYTDWMKKGNTALAVNKWEEAYKAFDEALKIKNGDAAAIKGKREADEKIMLSKLDPKARKIEEAYLSKMSAARECLAKKDYKGAIDSFKAALLVKPSDKAATAGRDSAQKLLTAEEVKDLVARAGTAMTKKDYHQAIKLYTEAQKLAPDNTAVKEGLQRARDEELREDKRRNAFDLEIRKGKKALTDKKYDEAVKCFEAALTLYPTNTNAKALLAEAKRRGKPIDPIVKKREENYQLAMSAAQAALDKRNYKGAINAFKAALVEKPGDKDATAGRASAEKLLKAEEDRLREEEAKKKKEALYLDWMKKGQDALTAKKWAEAYKAFDEALKIKPGDTEGIKGKRRADEELKKPKVDPTKVKKIEEDYQLAMSAAKAALDKKNYKGAINAFKAALVVKPGDKAATAGLASAEKLLKAEEDSLRAAEAKKEAAYLGWMKKGQDAMKAKKFADAFKAFDEALKIKNGDTAAIKGKRAADEELKKSKLDPKAKKIEEDYQLAMSAARAALDKKNYKGAFNAFKAALVVKPGDKDATTGRDSAEKLLKAEETKKPDPPVDTSAQFDKLLAAAQTTEKQRKYAEAVKAYQEALKAVVRDVKKNSAANTQLFKAWMGVGRSEHAAKRYTEAAKAYEEALKVMPNHPDAKAALARAKAGKP